MTSKLAAAGESGDRVLVVDFSAQARQEFHEQMAEFRKVPIDRTIRGGYYLNSDGSGAHNANGDPVPVVGEDGEHVEQLKQTASFNREPGAAEEAGVTPSGYRQTASDTGVKVNPEDREQPMSLDEVAAQIDARHEATQLPAEEGDRPRRGRRSK